MEITHGTWTMSTAGSYSFSIWVLIIKKKTTHFYSVQLKFLFLSSGYRILRFCFPVFICHFHFSPIFSWSAFLYPWQAESSIAALHCTGLFLGSNAIRYFPTKPNGEEAHSKYSWFSLMLIPGSVRPRLQLRILPP